MFREKFTEDLTERLFSDIVDITETLMAEHKDDVRRDNNIPQAKGRTMHEKLASSHGEGTRPVSAVRAPTRSHKSTGELTFSFFTGRPRLGLLKAIEPEQTIHRSLSAVHTLSLGIRSFPME